MASTALVSYADLEIAFEWVSSGAPMEKVAYVSRETGATHWGSSLSDLDEELPEDIDDASLYVEVPHKNDLNLGKRLAMRFTDERIPESSAAVVGFFRQRGAYRRFKEFLEQKDIVQDWYDYESEAVERALREWCEENGLQLKP